MVRGFYYTESHFLFSKLGKFAHFPPRLEKQDWRSRRNWNLKFLRDRKKRNQGQKLLFLGSKLVLCDNTVAFHLYNRIISQQ